MKRIEDERICFYLKQRALIEQWSRIEDDLPATCRKFLLSLQDDIEEIIAGLDGIVRLYKQEGNYPKLFLYRESWYPRGDSQRPMVGIGLEWNHKSVDFGKQPPYVGIWKDQASPIAQPLNAELARVADAVALGTKKRNSTPWWPARTFVEPPNENYWEDLTPYRELVIAEIRSYWSRFAPEVEGALKRAHERARLEAMGQE